MAQIEAAGLNDEEMALIIKRFKTTLKGRKGQPSKTKTKGKRSCFKCGKLGHFIANCPNNDSDQDQGNKREKKKNYKKAKGEAHLGNGERGKKPKINKFMKWLFYIYYPLHLSIIGIINLTA